MGRDERSQTLKYILGEEDLSPEELETSWRNLGILEGEMGSDETLDKDEKEAQQRKAIFIYERDNIVDKETNLSKGATAETIIQLLNESLRSNKDLMSEDQVPAK